MALICGFIAKAQSVSYPDSSVLAHGNWYAVSIPSNGIYKLTHSDFVALGVPEEEINFDNLSIFGSDGKAISEINADYLHSDLIERAVFVNNQGSKYALFYAQNTTSLSYDAQTQSFNFKLHPYSDLSTYFITFSPEIGDKKRIEQTSPTEIESTTTTSTARDVFIHKRELTNLLGSGRNWVGENFSSLSPTVSIPMNLPNIDTTEQIKITLTLLNESETSSSFDCRLNNKSLGTIPIVKTPNDYAAAYATKEFSTKVSSENNTLKLTFNGSAVAKGKLDYVKTNYTKRLRYNNSYLQFYTTAELGSEQTVTYIISNVRTNNLRIWDIDQNEAVALSDYSLENDTLRLNVGAQRLHNIVISSGSNFQTPILKGKVENQNLHGWEATDFVIVTAPQFLEQAERLAELHRQYDGINVKVATTQQVYNEFSSGTRDMLAIRELMRMLYSKYSPIGQEPKNLLLFGDGTFDNKNILKYNNNFIPTYQSENSLIDAGTSFTTDDVLAYLSPYATADIRDTLLIGIGRMTANDTTQAGIMVDKCERYITKADIREGEWGDWRNSITLTADDADTWGERYFIENAEDIYYALKESNPILNMEKIYSDAYKQYASSSGATYPDASKAINQRMKKGCLLFNYVGHGSDNHLSSERLITITDITTWNNKNALPLFITSTCEFTRFDQVDKQSAGEFVLSSENGGGIGLISAARKIPSRSEINTNLHHFAVMQENGKGLTFGEIFARSKNATQLVVEERSFVLFGDPALRISLPQYGVRTTKINTNTLSDTNNLDTIRALSNMLIEGEIVDINGERVSNFDGKVQITLFDKASNYRTLDNEGLNTDIEFEQQKNILHKGVVSVSSGYFSYSLTLPKDIAYNYGKGKISYYAQNDSTDAAGYCTDFIVGGLDTTVIITETRPDIRLFINDTLFRNGGITDENPELFAIVSDSIAINTVGSGLGHDIMARLDNAANTFILNDYFEPEGESSTVGTIRFPFSNLTEGIHTLSLKVWNIFNFSSEAQITFEVCSSKRGNEMVLKNYPNPFSESTKILLEHNQSNSILEAELQIFSQRGELVLQEDLTPLISAYTVGPFYWNGTTQGGAVLGNGVYFARMRLKTTSDEITTSTQKIVIFRNNR